MTVNIFDRVLIRAQRNRFAARTADAGFLFENIADNLGERLSLVRKSLPVMLDIGVGTGALSYMLRARGGTEQVVSLDLSEERISRAGIFSGVTGDAEMLPFRQQAFDGIVSCLDLQWVNDLPGAFSQIRHILKPDGVFLAAMIGGQTLMELRQCLMDAELELCGGVSPRVAPFTDMRDIGGLLQRAGFSLPVVDEERIDVDYASPFTLMHDLRRMGAVNTTFNRSRRFLRRGVLMRAADLYRERHATPDGDIRATFDVIFMIGWAPHESQQKPLMPGTAVNRLADVLGAVEVTAQEKARP